MPPSEPVDPLDTFEFRPYLQAVARQRAFVTACALALGVLAVVFSPGTEPTVLATRQIVLNDLSRYSALLAPVSPAAEASLFESRAVRAKVERQLGPTAPIVSVKSPPGSNVLTLSATASGADQARNALAAQVAAYKDVRSGRLDAEIAAQRKLTEEIAVDLDRQISTTARALESLDGTDRQQSTLTVKLGAIFERKIDNTTKMRELDAAARRGSLSSDEASFVERIGGTSRSVLAVLGFVVGALLGAVLAIALSVLHDRVSDRLDVAATLPNAPVLAESRRDSRRPVDLEKIARSVARSLPLDQAKRITVVPASVKRLGSVAVKVAEALQVEMGDRATVLVSTDAEQLPLGEPDEGDRREIAVILLGAGRHRRRSVVALADRLHLFGIPVGGVVLLDVYPTDLHAAARRSRY